MCATMPTMVDWQQTELDKHQKLLIFSSFELLYHWSFLPSKWITIRMCDLGQIHQKMSKYWLVKIKNNKIQHPWKVPYLNKKSYKFKLQKIITDDFWMVHCWITEYYKIKYVDYFWCDIINHIFEENVIISCHAGLSKYNKLYHKNKNIFRLSCPKKTRWCSNYNSENNFIKYVLILPF